MPTMSTRPSRRPRSRTAASIEASTSPRSRAAVQPKEIRIGRNRRVVGGGHAVTLPTSSVDDSSVCPRRLDLWALAGVGHGDLDALLLELGDHVLAEQLDRVNHGLVWEVPELHVTEQPIH